MLIKYIPSLSAYSLKPIIIDILLFSFYFMWVFLAHKYSDWKNWKTYYPTFLFWCLGDAIYNVLFYNNPLWKYKDPLLNHTLSEFFTVAIVFSSVTLLFLQGYPKSFINKVKYLAMWVAIFTGIEYIFYLLGSVIYYHSWNIGWSAVHNTYQFILLRLHYKRPLLAWVFAFLILIIMMSIFRIPLQY